MDALENKVKIGAAQLIDAADVALLIFDKANDAHKPFSETEKSYVMQHVLKGIIAGDPIILIAYKEKRGRRIILGFLMFDIRVHPYGKTIAWVEQMAVKKEYQRSGIGRQLAEASALLARRFNAVEAYVDTNEPELFAHFGLVQDHVVMKMSLVEEDHEQ